MRIFKSYGRKRSKSIFKFDSYNSTIGGDMYAISDVINMPLRSAYHTKFFDYTLTPESYTGKKLFKAKNNKSKAPDLKLKFKMQFGCYFI